MTQNKTKYYLELVRWGNVLIVIFTQILVCFYFCEKIVSPMILGLYVGSVVFTTISGYVINDFFDVEIDKVNNPQKASVLSTKPYSFLIKLYLVFVVLSVCLSMLVSIPFLIFNCFSILILFFYSKKLKRQLLIGNICVAIFSVLSFYSVHFLGKCDDEVLNTIAVFAFLITLYRELAKDVEDIEGDKMTGCKTFPVLFGLQKTIILLQIYLVSILCFVGLLLVLMKFQLVFVLVSILLIAFIIYLMFKTHHSKVKSDFSILSGLSKLFMLLGLLAIFLIRLF